MSQSVKAHFQENYEEEIYDAISYRIQEHPDELVESFSQLHRMGELTLEEIEVKNVYTERCSGDVLNFEISTCATVMCEEGNHHYDNEYEALKWYTVNGVGSLNELLDDFHITSVTPYIKGKRRSSKSLKDTFVPNITKENLDAVAEQVLKQYYPEALEHPMPIDTDVLLERIGLSKVERRISADASVFGQIYFEDAEPAFYNDDTGRLEVLHVKAGTILVDPMVFFLRNLGSVKNTIIHECVHWLFHRPVFVLEKISDSSLTKIDCAVVGGVRGRMWSTARQIEWQANALAPRIQMPASTFEIKAKEFYDEVCRDLGTDSILEVIEPVIERLAEFFEVSKLSAKIRLVELGCEEARGAFIYVDGHYVQPYVFNEGSLGEHQTFSIDAKSAASLCLRNYDLRELKESRDFLYVDSHFVYNHPQYVCMGEKGLVLTDYARQHMDECCLIFDMEPELSEDNRYRSICYLNRDIDGPFTFKLEYSRGLDKASVDKRRALENDALSKEREMLRRMCMDYTISIKEIIKFSGMTYAEIADEIEVDESTVKRTINKQGKNARKLAGMCLSMQLPPNVSSALINLSPWKLDILNDKDETDYWIDFALKHKYLEKMDTIKEFLNDHGIEEFGKSEKIIERQRA